MGFGFLHFFEHVGQRHCFVNIGYGQEQASYIDPIPFNVFLVKMIKMKNTDYIVGGILENRQTRKSRVVYFAYVCLIRVSDIKSLHINARGYYLVCKHRVKVERVLQEVALLLVKHALILDYIDNILKIVLGNGVRVGNTRFPQL